MSNLTSQSPEIVAFVAGVLAKRQEHYADCNYLSAVGAITEDADKFIRVYGTETDKPRNEGDKPGTRKQIHCFIAKADFANKALGNVKAGDILKPASYKAPAKHARGNVFAPDNGLDRVNHYGPAYLR